MPSWSRAPAKPRRTGTVTRKAALAVGSHCDWGSLVTAAEPSLPRRPWRFHGLGPMPPLCTEAASSLVYAHTQLGYIFETMSYVPNWIKTEVRQCGLNFQRLGKYIWGAGFHENSVCTVAETLPRRGPQLWIRLTLEVVSRCP